MTILNRVTQILQANINTILDKAENPESMVRQLIREIEENIIELRKETAKALSSQKMLTKKLHKIEARKEQLQTLSEQAFVSGNNTAARNISSQKDVLEEEAAAINLHLSQIETIIEKLQKSRLALEDKVQQVRRQKEEIIRHNIVRGHLPPVPPEIIERTHQAMQAGDETIEAIEKQKDKLLQLELENKALETLANESPNTAAPSTGKNSVEDPQKQAAAELKKLKQKLKKRGNK